MPHRQSKHRVHSWVQPNVHQVLHSCSGHRLEPIPRYPALQTAGEQVAQSLWQRPRKANEDAVLQTQSHVHKTPRHPHAVRTIYASESNRNCRERPHPSTRPRSEAVFSSLNSEKYYTRTQVSDSALVQFLQAKQRNKVEDDNQRLQLLCDHACNY